MDGQTLVDVIFKIIVSVGITGGGIGLLIKTWSEHRKSLDVRDELKVSGDVSAQQQTAALAKALADDKAESDRRQAELLNSMIGIVTSLIPRLDKLTSAQEAFTAESRVEHALEGERLKLRETELVLQRAALDRNTDAVSAFSPVLAGSVKDITTVIAAVGVKVDGMNEDITAKLNETKSSLDAMREAVEKLNSTIEKTLLPVPSQVSDIRKMNEVTHELVSRANEQLGELNRQLSTALHALAIQAAGGNTPQTDADHAANQRADSDAAGTTVKDQELP